MWYKNIAGRFLGLVTKHAYGRRTDRQTDRIMTPKTALASIAALHSKNQMPTVPFKNLPVIMQYCVKSKYHIFTVNVVMHIFLKHSHQDICLFTYNDQTTYLVPSSLQ